METNLPVETEISLGYNLQHIYMEMFINIYVAN